jgi:hypothetical protein
MGIVGVLQTPRLEAEVVKLGGMNPVPTFHGRA